LGEFAAAADALAPSEEERRMRSVITKAEWRTADTERAKKAKKAAHAGAAACELEGEGGGAAAAGAPRAPSAF
jgi:hypothetical protein